MTTAFSVIAPGIATSIQDRGRFGFAHLGLGRSGIVDQALAAALNRSLGNDPTTPILETAGGLVLECVTRCLVSMSGWTSPRLMLEGERIQVSATSGRQWAYLAVAGGFSGDPVLGSLSADTMAGITAVDVSVGVSLRIDGFTSGTPSDLIAPQSAETDVAVISGPHLDRLSPSALETLTSTNWVVENNSRVGVRLAGGALQLASKAASRKSEPMIVGALQIPPSGCPIILGRDHPVTGGYPVAAVIDDSGLSTALGVAVGSTLKFRLK